MSESAVKKISLVLAFAGTALLSGCEKNPGTIWSFESVSPEKEHYAKAENLQWGGPGNDYDAMYVELGQIFRDGKRGDGPTVLAVELNRSADGYITLHWRDEKHLEIGYRGGHAYAQSIRAMDVEISTHYIGD